MSNEYLGKDISKLGFGLMRLPMIGESIDMAQVEKMVDQYMKEGFTYFDTAYVYHGGQSEVVAREAIVKRYPRDTFQLATKMPVWEAKKYEDYQRLFDIQLERTGAGYFDFYLLHALDQNRAEEIDKMGAWDFVKEMKEKGFIKHFGFSFHDKASSLDDILSKHPEAEFVQLQINYIDWENDEVQSRECYEVARKHNIPIIIMEPIKGGSLAVMRPEIQEMFKKVNPELSVASWAMRFAASLEGVVTVLSGMSNMEQMEDNLSYMSNLIPLQEEERSTIQKVVEEIAKIPTIPCTACKYCVDECPQKINIPSVFNSYNDYKIYQNLDGSKGNYRWVTSGGGKASDCIACGSCESHCPQHISIIETLQEVAGVLE
ncbi:MAG: Fe-S oxidoreductase [Herbinix sp.]|jgi:predicted aldo/keto reductase-like oxidoreductase|nr:Fe-S oxidoreductase [Herbinix sp.]